MKINRGRVPPNGSALAEAVVDAGLDLIRGEPSTLLLLREAERYLAAVVHDLAKRGIKGVETGV